MRWGDGLMARFPRTWKMRETKRTYIVRALNIAVDPMEHDLWNVLAAWQILRYGVGLHIANALIPIQY